MHVKTVGENLKARGWPTPEGFLPSQMVNDVAARGNVFEMIKESLARARIDMDRRIDEVNKLAAAY